MNEDIRIRELEAEVTKWKLGCCDREDEAAAAGEALDNALASFRESQEREKKLRDALEAINKADHNNLCLAWDLEPCDCWKSKAEAALQSEVAK